MSASRPLLAALAAALVALGSALTVAPVASAGAAGSAVSSAATTSADAGGRPPACVNPEKPRSEGYAAATRHDDAFNARFRHCFLTIDGVQMHYVIGGTGPDDMLMVHGWPQSWYEFRDLMPELLPGRTVIAVDLPGMGDSTGEPVAYTKAVLSDYVHKLLHRIGRPQVDVVAHDLGVGVAYALAAQYRQQVRGLFLMDFPLVGKNLPFAALRAEAWHIAFNLQEPLAEQLVSGNEREFLSYFYPSQSPDPQPISARDVREYTRVYSRPQVLHAGFELYRAWPQDEVDNKRLQQQPLDIPVRLLAQDGALDFELAALRDAAPHATGRDVPGAGHWIPEEAPELTRSEIRDFFPAPAEPPCTTS